MTSAEADAVFLGAVAGLLAAAAELWPEPGEGAELAERLTRAAWMACDGVRVRDREAPVEEAP